MATYRSGEGGKRMSDHGDCKCEAVYTMKHPGFACDL